MSDEQTAVTELIPLVGAAKRLLLNLLLLRQVIAAWLTLYFFIHFAGGWLVKDPTVLLGYFTSASSFFWLGVLIWLIQESLNATERRKAKYWLL